MRPVPHRRAGFVRVPALAGAALFASALAAAAPWGFASPSDGERLQPGAHALASWTLDPSRARELNEAELVLSLDGGATYPVRLSERIPLEARSASWRVPALPTEDARLALRAGDDEETGTERILIVSESFSIASPGNQPLEELFPVDDEWRTREALEGAPVRLPLHSLSTSGAELGIDPSTRCDADDSGTGGVSVRPRATSAPGDADSGEASRPGAITTPTGPRTTTTPLRL